MNKFWSGFVFCGAIHSIQQDLIGKEKYMKLMDLMWVEAYLTIPLALLAIILSVYLFNKD